MKTLLFILFLNYFPQDIQELPPSYLKVVHEKGGSWINICQEGNKVKTVSFNNFIKAEPVITNSEGYELAAELERCHDSMKIASCLANKQIKEEILNSMINVFSQHYYHAKPEDLSREESLLLWTELTRVIFFHEFEKAKLSFCEKSKEAALIGETIWPLIRGRNSLLEDIMIFSIHEPGSFSVNLLLDMSGNIMTKVVVISDLYYHEEFSVSLLNKNSRALRSFAMTKQ